jgi:hypothetical protein
MINDGIPGEHVGRGPDPSSVVVSGGLIDSTPVRKPRRPIVIWIGAFPAVANPWANLEWGDDTVQDFATALVNFFNDTSVPEPMNADLVVGVDKEDNVVVLHITLPITGGNKFEQKEAPANLK